MSSSGASQFVGTGFDEVARQMPAAVVVVEARSRAIVYANDRARQMTEQQLGRPIPPQLTEDWAIFHPDGTPYGVEEWPLVRSLTSGEDVVGEEYFNVRPDGTRLLVRCSSSPIYDDERRVVAGLLVMTDVSAQMAQQEERLTYLAGLLDNTEDAIVALDAQWFVTMWNKGAERMYGWTADEVVGRHTLEVARLEISDEERVELRCEVAERGRWRGELVAHRKDGAPVCVELVTVALRGQRGEISGYLGIHRDVTDRKRAEQALREAQRRTEKILESITDAFVAVDGEWRYTYVNDRALRRMEARSGRPLTRDEVLGQGMWELFPDGVGTEIYDKYHEAMREQRPVEFETYFGPSDEWIEAHAYPCEGGLSIYYRNISERKQTEQALGEAQRRSEKILESITDAFVAVDREWRCTYVNKRAVDQARTALGHPVTAEELLGKSLWELAPQLVGTTIDEQFHRALREQTVVKFEAHCPAGRRWVEFLVYPSDSGVSVYSHDISERRRAEEEMSRQAEQQALVAELGQRALAGEDLQLLFDEAVGLVAATLDVELAAVAEIPAGSEELILRAGVGWREGVVGGRIEGGRASLVGYTLRVREPVIVQDMGADARLRASALACEHGVVSALSVMIESADEPFGTLAALSTRRRAFSVSEVSFVRAVANVLAGAVERDRTQQRLIEVREVERRRIARGLHDEALQDLTYALALAGRPPTAGGDRNRADECSAAIKRVGEQLRGAIYDLHLGDEQDTPFPELLQALIAVHRAMAADYEIELDVRDAVPAGPLGAAGVELLRILGEALTNARRHARASRVRVSVWSTDGSMHAEVSDDGHGFDPARPPHAGGHGITGMRERAALIHGRLEIRSDPAAGTTVRLDMPLQAVRQAVASGRVRVLLVEDHTAVLQAIAASFEREPDFTVVGQARSLTEARELLADVDVAVLDLGLPDGDGTDLIPELRAASPRAHVLVLSAGLDRPQTARAIEAGAAGAFDKTAELDRLVDAVRRLQAGQTLLATNELAALLRYARRRRDQEHDDRLAINSLTAREREVLQALGAGLDSQAIAHRLHISSRTQRNHVARILNKLGVHSQLQAVLFALRHGLIDEPPGAQNEPPG